jgi:hypothetical protein
MLERKSHKPLFRPKACTDLVSWRPLSLEASKVLLQVDDTEQFARFMQYLNGNLAREVGGLGGLVGAVLSKGL